MDKRLWMLISLYERFSHSTEPLFIWTRAIRSQSMLKNMVMLLLLRKIQKLITQKFLEQNQKPETVGQSTSFTMQ